MRFQSLKVDRIAQRLLAPKAIESGVNPSILKYFVDWIRDHILTKEDPAREWAETIFPNLDHYLDWNYPGLDICKDLSIDKYDLQAMFYNLLYAENQKAENAEVEEQVETKISSLIFEIEDEEILLNNDFESENSRDVTELPEIEDYFYEILSPSSKIDDISVTTTTKSASLTKETTTDFTKIQNQTMTTTTTTTTTQALTAKHNSDDFKKIFSTKTIVDLELEWKADFSDKNSEAFLEIEKKILDAFQNLRRKGKIFRINLKII